ncbi:MAG: hypothetical protein FJY73_00265 [Candidatus Eisenbacteria bacterium]|nr:hypothetical protein [Candidatus Eisenbacteria bacterium]
MLLLPIVATFPSFAYADEETPPPKKGAALPMAPGPASPAAPDSIEDAAPPPEEKPAAPSRPPVPVDSLLRGVSPRLDSFSAWTLRAADLSFYAPRSFADAAAARPVARADRFGPPAYFETIRVGGTGAPLVLVDGILWPREAGGLPNAGALPRQGIGTFALAGPRLLPELALAAPGGAILLDEEPWLGGPPRSVVAADRGADGFRDYRFGLVRDVTSRLALRFDGQFRKADAFTVDSQRAFSSGIAAEARLGPSLLLRARLRRHDGEEVLLDRDLRQRFSHRASDEREVLAIELLAPGMNGQAYRTSIHSRADAADAAYASTSVVDERSGLRLSRAFRARGAGIAVALRGEKREAEADGSRRESARGAVSAGGSFAPVPWGDASVALLGGAEKGERGSLAAEVSFAWSGVLPGFFRAGRFREERAVRRWIADDADPGVVRSAEAGIGFGFLPLRPKVRWFRREGNGVDHLLSVDAHLESFMRIDERTDGVEASFEGRAGAVEWEGSYAWIRAREKGKPDPLPYHSDHLARGRVSYERSIPRFPAVPRMDLLGEWRSDRRAPGRSAPMEDYFTLRGRVTLNVRGTDLFAEMEQVLGHQVEYIDGPLEGTDGVLSGSRQIYLGLVWAFTDG